ncbi:glycoside hydrolase family 15 protein [Pseudomonas syringae]|uniref:glycoside hydrolase family 15 protein n=1 Tax=Pseudomonas syringae TaxID=317 RepID=UPI001F3FC689|nr:glycoside hydrolase family 15 protein [Pseudomonas syringae]MCF5197074.1 hypothetical protein [Pseudomonas syringae]MCF5211126.1 hypothetical protein [Pseudomonas syringae]MCF5212582.1 hypothetical protein [Pseudomonas syringae]MCF5219311.1 hypothetical protein [Pseudomonas syringae]MCF5266717.1 hypothetical protein [Pseudomonas syringae]
MGGQILGNFPIGALPEAKAAFTWLIHRLREHGPHVCYTLDGQLASGAHKLNLPGYKHSPPMAGNDAAAQLQHGIYGDIFETTKNFVNAGNVLDYPSAEILSSLAEQCADGWMRRDSGIWELPELEHYTMSKISCWQALSCQAESQIQISWKLDTCHLAQSLQGSGGHHEVSAEPGWQ